MISRPSKVKRFFRSTQPQWIATASAAVLVANRNSQIRKPKMPLLKIT